MKPNNYTQILIHLVFATKYRECFLHKKYQPHVWKYISGIVNNLGHKCLIVNGMPDHVHILVGMKPKMSISDLVREIKRSSSVFINSQKWFRVNFRWQEGFGAFSHSQSQLPIVYRYIENQEAHHRKLSFHDEYKTILKEYNIDYRDKFLFKMSE